nr:MAG TPA: hypothetical protein [Caudoviricetes sp.]
MNILLYYFLHLVLSADAPSGHPAAFLQTWWNSFLGRSDRFDTTAGWSASYTQEPASQKGMLWHFLAPFC